MTLVPKSKLAIFKVSLANVIDEMMWNETYFGGSTSPLQKKDFSYDITNFLWKSKIDLICVIFGFRAQTSRVSEYVSKQKQPY